MVDDRTFRDDYHGYILKKVIFILILVGIILLTTCYSCTVSGREMSLLEGWQAIIDHLTGKEYPTNSDGWWNMYIVWNVTMPRVLAAIVCGSGLAVCGAVMQSLFSNPLAEPYTVGVSSGAVCGACFALIIGLTLTGPGQYGVVVNAFVFALIPMGVMLLLSKVIRNLSPVTMILAGTALSYLFSGVTTIMMVTTDSETLANAYRWQVGSLDLIFWDNVWIIFVVVAICSVFVLMLSKYLNAMSMGLKTAKSLGIDVAKVRMMSLLVCAVITAVIISFTGVIGFVGLVAPHIVRLFIGGDNKFVLPASMVAGATVLLVSDTLSRWVTSIDIPVGAMMMLIGAPLFIWLMIRKKSRSVIY